MFRKYVANLEVILSVLLLSAILSSGFILASYKKLSKTIVCILLSLDNDSIVRSISFAILSTDSATWLLVNSWLMLSFKSDNFPKNSWLNASGGFFIISSSAKFISSLSFASVICFLSPTIPASSSLIYNLLIRLVILSACTPCSFNLSIVCLYSEKTSLLKSVVNLYILSIDETIFLDCSKLTEGSTSI